MFCFAYWSSDNPKSFICHLNDRKVRRRAGIRKECTVGDLNSSCLVPSQPALPKVNLYAVSFGHTNIFNTYLRKMIYICCGDDLSFAPGRSNSLLIYASRSDVS